MNNWQDKASAPKTGEWILVCKALNETPFTVRYTTPFSEAPYLADWRDERGKVRIWDWWKKIP